MLNFDIEVEASKKTTVKYHNQTFFLNGNKFERAFSLELSSREANAVIEALYDRVKSQFFNNWTYLKSVDFDTFVNEVRRIAKVREDLIKLKEINCYHGKTLEDHRDRVVKLVNQFHNKIEDIVNDNFSAIESHVLHEVSYFGGTYYSYRIGHENKTITEYDAITDSTAEGDKNLKEALAYDYSKYKVGTKVITTINQKHKEHMKKVKAYRLVREEAGLDLVNWTQQKMTIRLRKHKDFLNYSGGYISDFVSSYVEHLLEEGLATKTDKSAKKVPKFQRVLNMMEDEQEVSQEDLVSAIKNCEPSKEIDVLNKMTQETLFGLLDIDTKSFKKKVKDGLRSRLVIALGKFKHNTKEFNKYYSFAESQEVIGAIPLMFFENNRDVFTKEAFKRWGGYYVRTEYPSESLDYVESNFNKLERLSFNAALTIGYMTERMSPAERLEVFRESPTMRYPVQINIAKLVSECSMESLREAFKSSPKAMNTIKWVACLKKDKELCNYYVETYEGTLPADNFTAILLKVADNEVFRNRIRRDLDKAKQGILCTSFIHSNHCTPEINQIILEETSKNTYKQTLQLFSTSCEKLGLYLARPHDLNKFLRGLTELNYWGYFSDILTKDTRKHLASLDPEFIAHSQHKVDRDGYDENLVEFFKDFNRADAETLYGKEFMFGEYRYYLAQAMDSKELHEIGNRDYKFLRLNIDQYNYGYLKKFKEKENFKKLVGDRRDTCNKKFGVLLLEKLQTSNSLEFMFS